jgi:hypothetical protein
MGWSRVGSVISRGRLVEGGIFMGGIACGEETAMGVTWKPRGPLSHPASYSAPFLELFLVWEFLEMVVSLRTFHQP